MVTEIRVEFVAGTYSGRITTADGHRPEWPPAPARILQALVASAGGDDMKLGVLRALEACAPPEIIASDRIYPRSTSHLTFYGPSRSLASTFPQETNDQKAFIGRLQYGSMRYLSNNPYSKAAPHEVDHVGVLADPTVIYRVLGLSAEQVEVLDHLAGEVAYVGRSRDVCTIAVSRSPDSVESSDNTELPAGRALYRPSSNAYGSYDRQSKDVRRLQGWGTGLVNYLESSYLQALTSVAPSRSSAHLSPWIHYRRVLSTIASDRAIPIHFVPALNASHWNALVETFPGSVPLFLPHRKQTTIYGTVINPGSPSSETITIPEALRTTRQILPSNIEVELGEARWVWSVTRSSSDWTTITPITGANNSTVVWAEVVSRLMASTGLDHTEIKLQLRPMPPADTCAAVSTHRRPGEYLWHADIHFTVPVTGPLCAGRNGFSGALEPAVGVPIIGGRHA